MKLKPVTLAAALASVSGTVRATADEPASCATPGLVLAPIVATHTLPPYPVESQRRNEQGTTVLWVRIGSDGVPLNMAITQSSGSGRLDEAAAQYGKLHWRWEPPMRDCKPTEAQMHMRVVWREIQLSALPPNADFKVTMPSAAYPPDAAARLEDGSTLLEADVDAQGVITADRVILGSGFADLDDRALDIVKKSPGLMKEKAAGKHISVSWVLPPGTLPPDYETMLITGMRVTSLSASP